MKVLRPVLVGLGVGAAVAFVIALLSPRRLDADDTDGCRRHGTSEP